MRLQKALPPDARRLPSRGFSLIELLVVLVILAMLGGIVGPRVMQHLGRAKSDAARLQIEDFAAALDIYYLESGHYPSSSEGLRALVEAPGGNAAWQGPYLKKMKIPLDPWGNEYGYESPGKHGPYDLYSLGADGAPGGEFENGDVLGWE